MPAKDDPVVIKKYANRRLYNTGTSTYVTLEDLAEMVKKGENFTVQDAKSGEDITHPVLTQIIFELENKEGQNMLPIPFLRQLISFYGDQMQMVVPSFLEQSMIAFAKEQERFREQMKSAIGKSPIDVLKIATPIKAIEEQARRNIEMFQNAMRLFTPFPPAMPGQAAAEPPRKETDREGRRAAGTEGADRRDAAQDRFHGVRSRAGPTRPIEPSRRSAGRCGTDRPSAGSALTAGAPDYHPNAMPSLRGSEPPIRKPLARSMTIICPPPNGLSASRT